MAFSIAKEKCKTFNKIKQQLFSYEIWLELEFVVILLQLYGRLMILKINPRNDLFFHI